MQRNLNHQVCYSNCRLSVWHINVLAPCEALYDTTKAIPHASTAFVYIWMSGRTTFNWAKLRRSTHFEKTLISNCCLFTLSAAGACRSSNLIKSTCEYTKWKTRTHHRFSSETVSRQNRWDTFRRNRCRSHSLSLSPLNSFASSCWLGTSRIIYYLANANYYMPYIILIHDDISTKMA